MMIAAARTWSRVDLFELSIIPRSILGHFVWTLYIDLQASFGRTVISPMETVSNS
jgi:hypothetical protein